MATSSARRLPLRAARERNEHELELLDGAVALVGSGGASRVVVILGDGEPVLARARFRAGQRGVILRETQREDGGRDVIVEPAG